MTLFKLQMMGQTTLGSGRNASEARLAFAIVGTGVGFGREATARAANREHFKFRHIAWRTMVHSGQIVNHYLKFFIIKHLQNAPLVTA
jgi:hypothetical protein